MNANNTQLNFILEWLLINFSNLKVVEELYLIGSVISKSTDETNDVDIVQSLTISSKDELIKYSRDLKLIKDGFSQRFIKSLHVTTFTQKEQDEFKLFMSLNQSIKIK